jgi:hypothetical protein
LIFLVGAIFLTVFLKEGTDSALKVWGAVGTLVGVLTGAIPAYFFNKTTTDTLKGQSDEFRERADVAEKKVEALVMTSSDAAMEAREKYPHLFEPRTKTEGSDE